MSDSHNLQWAWHLAARADRASIAGSGLGIRRPGQVCSAAEQVGNQAAVYLFTADPRTLGDFYDIEPDDDIWLVDVRDLELEEDPGSLGMAMRCRQSVEAQRLSLLVASPEPIAG